MAEYNSGITTCTGRALSSKMLADKGNTSKKNRLLFITNIPSPYRVAFFNELGKKCALTVLFERDASSERDESWKRSSFVNFKGIVLKGRQMDVDKSISFDVIHYLNKNLYDEIIVSNAATPTGMIAIQYMKMKGISYWIEGDGAFLGKDNVLKKWIKTHFIGKAKGYFSTSSMHDQYYRKYASNDARIVRYPFSSLTEKDIFPSPASDEEKKRLREKLGMTEEKIVVSVGRMIHRKGFDVLFQAVKKLSPDIGVYIIGGKPSEEYVHFVQDNDIRNLHIVDFKQKEELFLYYRAADVFVLPTRQDIWGLVINEAMAAGLPVITTVKCGAGLELVKEGINGYLVPVEDSNLLANRISQILGDVQLRNEMSKSSLAIIQNYTIEHMVNVHQQVLFGESVYE